MLENTLGGAIWVNLVNTQRIVNGEIIDILEDTSLFLGWLEDNRITVNTNIIKQSEEYKLLRKVFVQILEGHNHSASINEALEGMNRLLKDAPIVWSITSDREKLVWGVKPLEVAKEGFVHIVQSFLETISHEGLGRVRQCDHEECILYFLDTSKAGRRRWCNMDTCGNRHKAQNHYHKQKQRKAVKNDSM